MIGSLLALMALGSGPTQAGSATLELDHVYIWVGEGAGEEAAVLRAAGVSVEHEPTRHVGDGTSSISAVFENFYLELQYLDPTVSGASQTQAE